MADESKEISRGARIMAHKIIYGNNSYILHIAEINLEGELNLYPFESEIHSATFINGTVEIFFSEGHWYYRKHFPKYSSE